MLRRVIRVVAVPILSSSLSRAPLPDWCAERISRCSRSPAARDARTAVGRGRCSARVRAHV